jgi:hypothetical protein
VVYSEYKTNPQHRKANKSGSNAVDLVYQFRDDQKKTKRLVFSLKDVRVAHIPEIAPQSTSWEALVTASHELKGTKTEELRLLRYENKYAANLSSISQVEENCLAELKDKYLPELQLDSKTEGEVVAFALTRVGIHRVLASKGVSPVL